VFIRLLFVAFLADACIAQDAHLISVVKGMVITDESLAGSHLVVNLMEVMSHKPLGRAYVALDGSFQFRDVPSGSYTVELATQNGETIQQDTITINSGGGEIDIRLPVRENKPGPTTGTVSVQQLKHPVTAKSKRILADAQKASLKGEYLKTVEILKGALNDPAALPHARMNIGVAYLMAGQVAPAIPELQEAARLMPEDAVVRTNLAYALLLNKQLDAAETEGRLALQLDRNNSKARWVMGWVLLDKGSKLEEGVEDLRFASREIPKAKMALAQFYERTGQKDAAVRELREFLPQASVEDRAAVEQWISKLAAK
jgi:hypothetical protein